MSQPLHSVQRHTPTPEEFKAAQRSPEFQELRSKQRGMTFPLAIAGVVWFVIYIFTAMYTPGFFGIKLFGNVNLGIAFGFLQFVTTFLITFAYVRFSNRTLDPRATALRERLEREAAGAPETPEATR